MRRSRVHTATRVRRVVLRKPSTTAQQRSLPAPLARVTALPRFAALMSSKSRFLARRVLSEAHVAAKNRLAGPEGVALTGPPIETQCELPFPSEIKASYAISMRKERWEGMQARLGPWAPHVKMWHATDGRMISIPHWVHQGKAVPRCILNRGQLGCHDSHFRLWQHIVQQQIPMTLCFEDDANFRHTRATATMLRKALDEAAQLFPPATSGGPPSWHILYLGRQKDHTNLKRYSASMVRPQACCGLFAYILTLEGARRLAEMCKPPYSVHIDVLVGRLSDQGKINALAVYPRAIWVCPVSSDTRNIF